MDHYHTWNQLIIRHVLRGIPKGAMVYLDLHSEVLQRIGQHHWGTEENFLEHFKHTIRQRVLEGNRVNLKRLSEGALEKYPCGVGFLAFMVLVAYEMSGDDQFDVKEYFPRLSHALGLPLEDGRPRGLNITNNQEAPEAHHWREWTRFLASQGYLSAAKEGEGPWKYVNYPVSQTLMRKSDRMRLHTLFTQLQLSGDLDAESLARKVLNLNPGNHVREVLKDPLRRPDALDLMLELHQDWKNSRAVAGSVASERQLQAGLFRTEDYFRGVVYQLYPREPRGWYIEQALVETPEGKVALSQERPGWYQPILEITPEMLDAGVRLPVHQAGVFKQLVLPRKSIWVLSPDAEAIESGIHASWKAPSLGVPFVALVKKEWQSSFDRLKEEGLLEFQRPTEVFPGWLEYGMCRVIRTQWDGVMVKREVMDALRPLQKLDLVLSGGLRIPHAGGWLKEAPPCISVLTSNSQSGAVMLSIRDMEGHLEFEEEVLQGQRFQLPRLPEGQHLLTVQSSEGEVQKLLNVLDAGRIPPAPHRPGMQVGIQTATHRISGYQVRSNHG